MYPGGIFGVCGRFVGGVNFCAGLGGAFCGGQQVVGDFGGDRRNSFESLANNFIRAPMPLTFKQPIVAEQQVSISAQLCRLSLIDYLPESSRSARTLCSYEIVRL